MIFESIVVPSQAMIPLGIALGHLILLLYIIYQRRFISYIFPHLFIAYLVLAILWNLNLVFDVVNSVPSPFPGLTWNDFIPYGVMLLGFLFWLFAQAFLRHTFKSFWVWGIGSLGLIGIALTVSLDAEWIVVPPEIYTASGGWVYPANIVFVIGATTWWVFIIPTFLMAQSQLYRTQMPAHKNRIKYLLIATAMLAAGYGLYLTLIEPYWMAGLIVTWLGSIITGYIVVVENLVDLSTAIRRTIRTTVIVGVTIVVYIAGISLVEIFLVDFLASTFLSRFLDPVLLVASVSAVLLTIIYTPVKRVSQNITNRVLFGQRYDYQTVIESYTQAISNILYLDQLATVALKQIKQTLGINEAVLFVLDSVTDKQLHFRTLPNMVSYQYPEILALTKDTPVLHRLMYNGEPLAQYTLDISPHFKNTPSLERQTLKELHLEWFIPVLRKQELIGIFALGPKNSQQPYAGEDLRLLSTLADHTALALENANLVDQLQHNLQEITRMKNLMDNVFDSMDNAVVTLDLNGKITLFNKAAKSILNLPPAEQSLGKPYQDMMPGLAKTILPNLLSNVLKREEHYLEYEIIAEMNGQGHVNLNTSLAPLKDAHHKTLGITMVMDDLTETKRLQAVGDMFRRYVSPAVVDRLPSDPSELELGGHRQEVSVLFADIRGFTTFSENLEPEKLVDILNEYLSMAAASILMYEGTLDKFMGDAVMGIFNAPLDQEDHVLRAVRAAMAMQRAIADYHHSIGKKRGLSFGIGVHVGEAVVGNVGMSARMDYTAIGDTVNLAKRIQENTPGDKILISDDVHRVVNSSIKSSFFKEMQVKGRKRPVKTYEVKL